MASTRTPPMFKSIRPETTVHHGRLSSSPLLFSAFPETRSSRARLRSSSDSYFMRIRGESCAKSKTSSKISQAIKCKAGVLTRGRLLIHPRTVLRGDELEAELGGFTSTGSVQVFFMYLICCSLYFASYSSILMVSYSTLYFNMRCFDRLSTSTPRARSCARWRRWPGLCPACRAACDRTSRTHSPRASLTAPPSHASHVAQPHHRCPTH